MDYDTAATLRESELKLRRRAAWLFRTVLIASTAASIAGNTLHAVMQHGGAGMSSLLPAGVGMIAPIVLLIMTEVLSIASKLRLPQASAYYFALATTVAIEAIAFMMSYDALRDLAGRNGVRPTLTWFWPLLIDIPAAIASMWLLLVSRAPTRVEQQHPGYPVEPAIARIDEDDDPEQDTEIDDGRVVAMVGPQRELPTGAHKHDDGAVRAVMASNRTKQPPEVVREILTLHGEGKTTTEIGAVVKVHHSTVNRIIATALHRESVVS